MPTERSGCDFCDEAGKWKMKIMQNCEELRKIDDELHGTRDHQGLFTQIALIEQRLKNLMWPILVILGAVLASVGKNLLTFLGTLGAG